MLGMLQCKVTFMPDRESIAPVCIKILDILRAVGVGGAYRVVRFHMGQHQGRLIVCRELRPVVYHYLVKVLYTLHNHVPRLLYLYLITVPY